MEVGSAMSESQAEIESATESKPGRLPVEEVRSLIDACWKAKTITELMPALPKGLKPRYVHVIDAVWHINEQNGQNIGTARVGDVSAFLGVTTPSITKLVGEMAELGLVVKHADATDAYAHRTRPGYPSHLRGGISRASKPAARRADRGPVRNHGTHLDRSLATHAAGRQQPVTTGTTGGQPIGNATDNTVGNATNDTA